MCSHVPNKGEQMVRYYGQGNLPFFQVKPFSELTLSEPYSSARQDANLTNIGGYNIMCCH